MFILEGIVQAGVGDFKKRIIDYPDAFQRATGEVLYPGTLNVKVDQPVPINEHFRVIGTEINEPHQDLLFEICRINGIWAYRIRPYILSTGHGGWGDDILEIASSEEIQNVSYGSVVMITLFR